MTIEIRPVSESREYCGHNNCGRDEYRAAPALGNLLEEFLTAAGLCETGSDERAWERFRCADAVTKHFAQLGGDLAGGLIAPLCLLIEAGAENDL